jgi:uridine kinase
VVSIAGIVGEIQAVPAPDGMVTPIVAIDGPGGSGKSTLAGRLSEALGGAALVHTDDFASWDNPLDWWPRLIEQVLKPLALNRAARYQRYDWDLRQLAEWHVLSPAAYLVLEGVSASRQAFRPYLSYSIWVETPRAERLRRGLERDGEALRAQWEQWMIEEDAYVEREQPRRSASVIVSGTERLQ